MIRILLLALRLHLAAPDVPIDTALANATAAVAVETSELTAELLLAVARVESNYRPSTVSRPHGAAFPIYCSILQTAAMSERECARQRTHAVAYRLGASEIGSWSRRCRGDVTCMLNGHGCGHHGVTTGRCNRYAARVLRFERRLRSVEPWV